MTQKKLDFHPSRHGYHFENTFENHFGDVVVSRGLCGGMVMSALDYWRAGIAIPGHRAEDFGKAGVPAEGTKLRSYIYQRQVDSLATKGTVSRWIVFPGANTPKNFHDWAMHSEFELVKQQIDMGRPAMLGLWVMRNGPVGHQVLCYGYETSPPTLFLYDPNLPDQEATLRPVSPEDGCEMKDERGQLYGEKHYRGYFFADVYNWAQDPPYRPPYNDLVVEPGITLTPSGAVVDGSPLDAVAVVRNVGDYPVQLRSLNFWFRAPDVTDPSKYRHPFATPVTLPFVLKPGEERNVGGHAASFGGRPGVHAAAVTADVSGDPGKPLPRGSTGKSSQTSIRVRVRPETDVAPAAASLGKTLYLFHKGLNNRIYVNAASDSAPFAGWAEVQDDGRTDRAVAAAPLGKRIYVFARGIEDRRVYVNSALEGRAFDGFGAGWSEVQPNGFTARTSPAAAAFDGRLHVFAVGDDRLVHVNSAADGSPFSGWSPLPIAGAPDNGTDLPVAAAAIGNRLYVFCVFDEGLSAGVYYCTRVAGQPFSAWKPVDGGLSVDGSAPAAAVLGDRVYVFAKKGDCIYANSARAGAPFDGFGSGWRELPGGGKTDRAVAAASLGNRIHCFAKGSDDKHLYVNSAVEGHAFGLWSEVPW